MTTPRKSSYAEVERKLEERTRELAESVEQQAATAEILRIIASSPSNIQPVLDAVAESAARLCGAHDVVIRLVEGNAHRAVAHHGPIPVLPPDVLTRENIAGRAIANARTVHIADITEAHVREEYPEARGQAVGHRTFLAVPLMREASAIGIILMRRLEVRPFTDKQIKLLETFAAQAVIAIENVGTFNELQARNQELTQSLEQQTATAEILRIIASSPSNIQPVLDAVAENAARLCKTDDAAIRLVDGDTHRPGAHYGPISENPVRPLRRKTLVGRAVFDRQTLHIPDIREEAVRRDFSESHFGDDKYRTVLMVPLVRDDKGLGIIGLRRIHVQPFTAEQIKLLEIFADQAVIAIENVRLFNAIQDKTSELEAANRQLDTASRHKSAFLAGMSHELRTPLNAIIGFTEVLREQMFGAINGKQAEYLSDIHSSSLHLLSLINDILDLSKIEAGRMDLELSRFDLCAALDTSLALVRERASRNNIDLKLDCDLEIGEWTADERKFRQITLNLLSNALKFTPPGGMIVVRARRVNGYAEIAVSDTGVGIKPEDQPLVFEEFRQVGDDTLKKLEGTGLGLALTKKFVELHGGTMRLESDIGNGSTFTFTLPETWLQARLETR